jgi:hypothetical protein
MNTEENKKIGKFKPKRKFLNFIQGKRGGVRLLSEFAYVRGKNLSGTLEDVIFKVTICDEGTIDFEEVDTNICNEEMIQRLIDDIDAKDVTGYMHKYVVYGLDFEDSDGNKAYLEVEQEKPISKLFNLFNEIENEMKHETPSDKTLSILDQLFDEVETSNQDEDKISQILFESETEDELKREFEGEVEDKPTKSFMELEFERLNNEKIQEIADRVDKKEKEINKLKVDIKQNESSLTKAIDDYRVLNSRLESLKPKLDPNGYVFFISEENKTGIEASDEVKRVVEQISPILKLNSKAVIDLLTKGFYTIKISKKDDLKIDETYITSEILSTINKVDIEGKISTITPSEYEYRGEMNWHQLVDKMLKLGFEQDPEFDKMCGSNSYESTTTESNPTDTNGGYIMDNHFKQIDESNSENKNIPDGQTLSEFNKPTDIVIIGYGGYGDGFDFSLTDDESSFDLYVGNELVDSVSTMGFCKIMDVDSFIKFREESDVINYSDLCEVILIPNFKGKIEILSKKYEGGFTTDFDMSDFIEHQVDGHVVVKLPENTEFHKLKDDWSLPLSFIRNKKIEEITD